MDSAIVIKVKYGNTLRRFNARIDEFGNLDLSLTGLFEKVSNMFNLSPNADITLTYLDEDNDSITLADDEDLKDVMRQSLDPLRITVKVNSENPSINSSGNSTPMRSSSRVSKPFPDFSNTVSEILKAVPEPLGEALTKLSHDVASKAAAASSPQLPELVQQFSKMLQSIVIPVSDSQVAKEPEVSGGDNAKGKATAVPESVSDPPRKNNTFFAPEFSSLNVSAEEGVKKSGESSSNGVKPDWENIEGIVSSVMDSPLTGLGQLPFFRTPVENGVGRDVPFKRSFSRDGASGVHLGVRCDVCGVKPIYGPRFKSKVKVNYDLCGTCFEVMGSKADYIRMDGPVDRLLHGGFSGISHMGVKCDECGANPITGPRFKSKVIENYDLCLTCFGKMRSDEADYIKMDRPVYWHPHIPKKLLDINAQLSRQTSPHVVYGSVKQNEPKLDSRFIIDVNVMDGAVMAPSTPFTKIWRMRNNGTVVWPQGTQVVWIGGDKLSASLSAGLQIPGEGLAIGNDLEIAVEFKAPEFPGRYISYWRMASPSGEKFGQRIWALIQVDASAKDSTPSKDYWPVINLNFPPDSISLNEPKSKPNNDIPIVINGHLPINEPLNKATDLVEPLVVPRPTKNQEHDFPINDNLLVDNTPDPLVGTRRTSYPTIGSSVVPPQMPFTWGYPPTVSYPKVDSSAVPLPMPPREPPVFAESATRDGDINDDLEVVLLLELKEMGFKQMDLNKEILRKNNYDLEQSLEALCRVSEWDPILEELQEMGFYDTELNKKLLKKNNGSIKDAVMDLISGEKPQV